MPGRSVRALLGAWRSGVGEACQSPATECVGRAAFAADSAENQGAQRRLRPFVFGRRMVPPGAGSAAGLGTWCRRPGRRTGRVLRAAGPGDWSFECATSGTGGTAAPLGTRTVLRLETEMARAGAAPPAESPWERRLQPAFAADAAAMDAGSARAGESTQPGDLHHAGLSSLAPGRRIRAAGDLLCAAGGGACIAGRLCGAQRPGLSRARGLNHHFAVGVAAYLRLVRRLPARWQAAKGSPLPGGGRQRAARRYGLGAGSTTSTPPRAFQA